MALASTVIWVALSIETIVGGEVKAPANSSTICPT